MGDHLAAEDRVDTDVIRDGREDRRILGQVDRASRGQLAGRLAQVSDHVHRVGRRASVAESKQRAPGVQALAQHDPRRYQRVAAIPEGLRP